VNQYQAYGDESRYLLPAAEAAPTERAAFLKNVYVHLLGAVIACVGLTALLMVTPAFQNAMRGILGARWGGLILIIGVMAATVVASNWAHHSTNRTTQYSGLGLAVILESILFALLLPFAERVAPGVSQSAAIITLAIFATLTAVVFYTGINFNFLAPLLWAAFIAAIVAIVLNIVMGGASLGPWFAAAMIVVASGYILYDTSRIMREYPTSAYVGASLTLFTSVAMLFWYVIRLLMQLKDGD